MLLCVEALFQLVRVESREHAGERGPRPGNHAELMRAEIVVRILHRSRRRHEALALGSQQMLHRHFHRRRELQRVVLSCRDHRHRRLDLALGKGARDEQVERSLRRGAQQLAENLHELRRQPAGNLHLGHTGPGEEGAEELLIGRRRDRSLARRGRRWPRGGSGSQREAAARVAPAPFRAAPATGRPRS